MLRRLLIGGGRDFFYAKRAKRGRTCAEGREGGRDRKWTNLTVLLDV